MHPPIHPPERKRLAHQSTRLLLGAGAIPTPPTHPDRQTNESPLQRIDVGYLGGAGHGRFVSVAAAPLYFFLCAEAEKGAPSPRWSSRGWRPACRLLCAEAPPP
eukprot:1176639-Prorocentrum_minimum.AAC.1